MTAEPQEPNRRAPEEASDANTYGTGKIKLLAAAEKLFTERGVDDVSLREICIEGGQANHSAVQLHFGNKAGLIRAVVMSRMYEIDLLRRRRLDALPKDQALSLRDLITCMFMPWADDVDAEGQYRYGRLIARLQQFGHELHPTFEHPEIAPTAIALTEALRRRVADRMSRAEFQARLQIMVGSFLNAILYRGHVGFFDDPEISGGDMLEIIIDIAVSALEAPATIDRVKVGRNAT
jgi:AcrR family transcriptional regulator